MKQIFYAFVLALMFSFSVFGQSEDSPCIKTENTRGIVSPGMPVKFVATLSGKTDEMTLEYEWKVSAGTISSGQGTCSITVDTTGLPGGTNITAEVKVKGLPNNCPNTASETISVVENRISEPFDRFEKAPRDEIRARIDALFVGLGNAPNSQGYIINYGRDKEITARENIIKEHAAFRKYDINRISFINCGLNSGENLSIRTTFIIYPPGATPPTCR